MSSKKRQEVFTSHVINKIFPAENEVESFATPKKHSQSSTPKVANVKVYTVQLPPEGLKAIQAQRTNIEATSQCDVSEESEDDEPSKKRKRKRKYRKSTSKKDLPLQRVEEKPHKNNELASPQLVEKQSSQLTKNQRKKLRKKRTKLGKGHDQTRFTSEFVVDYQRSNPIQDGGTDETEYTDNLKEVKEFIEGVWRVFECDRMQSSRVIVQSQPYQTLMDQLVDNRLPSEPLNSFAEIKTLLVLQDFPRARMKLSSLLKREDLPSQSGNISVFSSLAEYWMNDIAAVRTHSSVLSK